MLRIATARLGGNFAPGNTEVERTRRECPGRSADRSRHLKRRPSCERLEDRSLMTSTPGYDYVLTGYSWPDPNRITYSIAPDGVFWDHGTNNLNATFNAKFGAGGTWQKQIARALATWQSVANINIVPVGDGAYDFNTLGSAQGDSRFGDIRFGGYPFPNNTTTLAQTYFPPPNGATAAGDVEVNTSMGFNIGSSYDVYSVLLHETGHSLGLDHPKNPAVVMAANYGGLRTGLTAGDIAGIQAIYGPRPPDAYQRVGQGLSFSAPIDVSAALSGSNQAVVSATSLSTIGSGEYFSFVAPAYAAGTLQVTAAASNTSMLSPAVSVYDASGKLLDQASNPAAWSDNVTASVAGVVAGQRYFVAVTGATNDVFSVGAYQLLVSLPSSSPSVPAGPSSPPSSPPATGTSPPTSLAPGVSPDRFEPNNSSATATWLGRVTQGSVSGVDLNNALDVDFYKYQSGSPGSYQISAPGTLIQVYSARGRYLAGGANLVNLPAARAGAAYLIRVSPPSFAAVAGYSLSIGPRPVSGASRKTIRPRHQDATPETSSRTAIPRLGTPDRYDVILTPRIGFAGPSPSANPSRLRQSGFVNRTLLQLRARPWAPGRAMTSPFRKESGESSDD
jgi:hypothetical protein